MIISGWGRYGGIDAQLSAPRSENEAVALLRRGSGGRQLIARGMGRSYGDSAVQSQVLDTRWLDHFIALDAEHGILEAEAGVTLQEILALIIPRGWFLAVTPGTQFVTLGGAIASDVHGKNHHVHGSFGQHVVSLRLLQADGGVLTCSPTENAELFRASCGGMGLTGLILSAAIRLMPMRSSEIEQELWRAQDLDHILELFEQHAGATYSVAWIDCLARGSRVGRSLLMLGEHSVEGPLAVTPDRMRSVPDLVPSWCLNSWSIRAMNALYYAQGRSRPRRERIGYRAYFYPLDALADWNRLYGRNGFLQYQCVVPKADGRRHLQQLLAMIAASGKGSFLAVLKQFGPGNEHFLSFPIEGYTLALDFKVEPGVFELLDRLDHIVTDAGGRVYLAKDARLGPALARRMYPNWDAFRELRARSGADAMFASRQSQRLEL